MAKQSKPSEQSVAAAAPVSSEAWARRVYDEQIAGLLQLANIGRDMARSLEAIRAAEVVRERKRGVLPTSEAAIRSEAAYQKSLRRVTREVEASWAQALGMMERRDQPLQ